MTQGVIVARRARSRRASLAQLRHELRQQGWTYRQIAACIRDEQHVNMRVAFRLAHGWTQAQVAERWNARWPDAEAPKTGKHISYWETWPTPSGRAPSLDTLDKLACLYQCSARDLLDSTDYSNQDPAAASQPTTPEEPASRTRPPMAPTLAQSNKFEPEPQPSYPVPLSTARTTIDGPSTAAGALSEPGPDTVAVRLELGDRKVVVPFSRRLLLQAGIGSFVEAFALGQQPDLLDEIVRQRPPVDHVAVTSPAQLREIVTHLREQWHAQVKTDNLLGPRFALAGVLNQITVVEALLPVLRGEQRREIVRLGAQYSESVAWLYEDVGNMAQARYWTSRAMEWAHEGDDERMVAWTIFRRSQQAAATPDAAQVIGLAQAARRHEEQLATPTRAAIRVQEAYGHALDGEEQTAQRLLNEAHTWAASDTVGDARDGHGSYCTPSYIEIQRANCWLTTGKPKKAIMLYEESLRTLPVVYQRNRAAALSQLAMAYVADGQLEQAASAAHAALPVARSTGSRRIFAEIQGVGAKLTPHRSLQPVAALLNDLDADKTDT